MCKSRKKEINERSQTPLTWSEGQGPPYIDAPSARRKHKHTLYNALGRSALQERRACHLGLPRTDAAGHGSGTVFSLALSHILRHGGGMSTSPAAACHADGTVSCQRPSVSKLSHALPCRIKIILDQREALGELSPHTGGNRLRAKALRRHQGLRSPFCPKDDNASPLSCVASGVNSDVCMRSRERLKSSCLACTDDHAWRGATRQSTMPCARRLTSSTSASGGSDAGPAFPLKPADIDSAA